MASLAGRARGWFREPLVQFLIGGMAVFIVSAWRGNSVDPASRTIVVGEAEVDRLVQRWAQTWQRTPTQDEIDGLIRDYIKEEIYYREAKRLGLDDDDMIIRRRLRSKMEFLAAAEAESAVPDDATLQAVLDREPQKYAADARVSFDQIYVGTSGAAASAKAAMSLGQLRRGAAWQTLGVRISLPMSVEAAPQTEVARNFGDGFAVALVGQKPGGWAGPVSSGFGLHLVRVRAVKFSGQPRLVDVRRDVENDWRAATIRMREAKAYQALLDGYAVRIAKP